MNFHLVDYFIIISALGFNISVKSKYCMFMLSDIFILFHVGFVYKFKLMVGH